MTLRNVELLLHVYFRWLLKLCLCLYSNYNTQYNVIIIIIIIIIITLFVTTIINIQSSSVTKVDPLKPKKGGMKKVATGALPSSGGLNPIAILVLLIAIACGVYFSQIKK